MKPKFSKPFSAADAHAGAPYSCADGTTATILKWDMRGPACPIAGAIDNGQFGEQLVRWTAEGVPCAEHGAAKTLVMLPLGLIDGKPVYLGDKLVTRFGDEFTVEAKHIGCLADDNTWPAPAKAYPVTTMTSPDLTAAFDVNLMLIVALENVANAALRHAVDAGQVVPKDEHEAALRRLGEQLKIITLDSWAARDMAVAEAVRDATYVKVMNCQGGHEGTAVRQLDLGAIIARVPA